MANESDFDSRGKFAKGNKAAVGRRAQCANKAKQIRAAFFDAVDDEDMRVIMRKLIDLARDGDVKAIQDILGRAFGHASREEDIEREAGTDAPQAQRPILAVTDDTARATIEKLQAENEELRGKLDGEGDAD